MSSFNLVQIVPSLDSGGVERGTVDVANFLAEKKIQNFIITSSGKMIKEQYIKMAIHILLLNSKVCKPQMTSLSSKKITKKKIV